MKAKCKKFTLTEVLISLIFIAVIIPVAFHGILIANRLGRSADQRLQATSLGESLLNEIVVSQNWQNSETTGEFAERPSFHWQLTIEPWQESEEEVMDCLTITVYYQVQGNEYSVQLSTLVEANEDAEIAN